MEHHLQRSHKSEHIGVGCRVDFDPKTFVGEVVMKREMTPLLEAAAARGCRFQVGTDMLFEQIPAYLEFFGYGTTTPEELRGVATVSY